MNLAKGTDSGKDFKESRMDKEPIHSVQTLDSSNNQATRKIARDDDDGGIAIVPKLVVKHLPKRPQFRGQMLIDSSRVVVVDCDPASRNPVNSLALQYNFLSQEELNQYLMETCRVVRYGGKSVYNSVKPRREVCYTVDGRSFRYSNQNHISEKYPPHTWPVLRKIGNYLHEKFKDHPYLQISSALDILYSKDFERGGSVGSHADDEEPWGIVAILSLGQTRWLRVRRRSDGYYYNIEMRHNSLTVMFGPTFQELYTHQVDKLHPDDIIYPRLSLNVRYLSGPSNLHIVTSASLSSDDNRVNSYPFISSSTVDDDLYESERDDLSIICKDAFVCEKGEVDPSNRCFLTPPTKRRKMSAAEDAVEVIDLVSLGES